MDKEKQKQLIIDIMNDDAKDGLYKQTAMISKIRNKWFKINFVLRHRWEGGGYTNYEARQMQNTFNLGLWMKTYEVVGNKKGSVKEVFSKNNHVRVYMIGLDLIVCKVWMDISRPTFGSNK